MNLNETNLKKVIKAIEIYGAVRAVKIKNSDVICSIPLENEVKNIELNRPQTYIIEFVMGKTKGEIKSGN